MKARNIKNKLKAKMVEFIASISLMGFLGVMILVFGYIAIFWLAQVIDTRDPYDDERDTDE
jgi:hypothetical protein